MPATKIMDEIIANKHDEIARKMQERPLKQLVQLAAKARPVRNFSAAIDGPGLGLIAEIKRRSPSKGTLCTDFMPIDLAKIYQDNGARAISVIADAKYFGNSIDIVECVCNSEHINIPVMYKDFIIDSYQVFEARACGADAILMIVRSVSENFLQKTIVQAHELGLATVAEAFTEKEALIAVNAGAQIIGINNRDLQSFKVDLNRSARLHAKLPKDRLTICESGLSTPQDIRRVAEFGFDAVLIGEALLTAPDIAAGVRTFAESCGALPVNRILGSR